MKTHDDRLDAAAERAWRKFARSVYLPLGKEDLGTERGCFMAGFKSGLKAAQCAPATERKERDRVSAYSHAAEGGRIVSLQSGSIRRKPR